jgi:hypothetical protein
MARTAIYLEQFRKVAASGTQPVLVGSRLIVEVLPKEELKSRGGLFLAGSANVRDNAVDKNRRTLAVVLQVGQGDTETSMISEVGNVVMLPPEAMIYYNEFPGLVSFTAETLALTKEEFIQMRWPSLAAYESYCQAMLDADSSTPSPVA